MSMNIRALVTEAAKDIATGTARTVSFFILLGVLFALLSCADLAITSSLIREAKVFKDSGAATITVSAEGRIVGQVCDAFEKMPGVEFSGAMRASEIKLVPVTLPRSPVDVYDVTQGFLDVIQATVTGAGGASFSGDVIEATGIRGDAELMTESGPVGIAGVYRYPADGRRSGFGWAGLIPDTYDDPYDECWVTMWPYNSDMRATLMTAVSASPSEDAKVVVSQLNTKHGSSFAGHDRFRARITALNPLVAAALGLLSALLAVRIRRLELAARLHDGASPGSLQGLLLIENLSWLVPSALVGSAIATWVTSDFPTTDSEALVAGAASGGLAMIAGGVCGSIFGVLCVQERHLFAYFKDR